MEFKADIHRTAKVTIGDVSFDVAVPKMRHRKKYLAALSSLENDAEGIDVTFNYVVGLAKEGQREDFSEALDDLTQDQFLELIKVLSEPGKK